MELSLNFQARRALLQQTVPQYREASPSQKRTLVDAFVAATGYHRTYARWLLSHADEVQPTLQRPRSRQYGPDVQHALFLVWHAANRICAKRLIPFLLPYSRRWSDMSISTSQKSAASNCFP